MIADKVDEALNERAQRLLRVLVQSYIRRRTGGLAHPLA